MTASDWLVWHRRNALADARLFCFAPAGAGAATFRQWPKLLPPHLDVVAVQLPGRENRIAESPLVSLDGVVREVVHALTGAADRPFAFFGHSLGALVAFEVARRLRRSQAQLPTHLFLSARRAAQLQLKRSPFHDLPRAALVEELRRMGGTPAGVLANDELMTLLLPTLRADFALNDLYRYVDESPLDVPCSLLYAADDSSTPAEDIAAWRAVTRQDASIAKFHGGHFFIDSSRREVTSLVAQHLDDARYLPRTAATR